MPPRGMKVPCLIPACLHVENGQISLPRERQDRRQGQQYPLPGEKEKMWANQFSVSVQIGISWRLCGGHQSLPDDYGGIALHFRDTRKAVHSRPPLPPLERK